MLVSELKKVIEIDDRISTLHKQLSTLYAERARYVQIPIGGPTNSIGTSGTGTNIKTNLKIPSDAMWVEQTYQNLKTAWSRHNITIPPLTQLKKQILNAAIIISKLYDFQPDFYGKYQVVIVPPVQLIGQPGRRSSSIQQDFIKFDDFVSDELPSHFRQKSWRMLVAYNASHALECGNAKQILDSKSYMIGGYDLRALGVFEYFAFSLQQSEPMDEGTWALLLKNSKNTTQLVPSVTFYKGQYRYELDDVSGVFGDERFRPAVEVKA